MTMPIQSQEYNQVCVLSVEGDLDEEQSKAIRKLVDDSIDQRHMVDFVIDLEKSPFVDSQGLETLLWIKRRTEDLFGTFKLVKLDENLRKILEMTRLEHRFECQPDLEAALKTMG
jgi:anti-anti-sigma factor